VLSDRHFRALVNPLVVSSSIITRTRHGAEHMILAGSAVLVSVSVPVPVPVPVPVCVGAGPLMGRHASCMHANHQKWSQAVVPDTCALSIHHGASSRPHLHCVAEGCQSLYTEADTQDTHRGTCTTETLSPGHSVKAWLSGLVLVRLGSVQLSTTDSREQETASIDALFCEASHSSSPHNIGPDPGTAPRLVRSVWLSFLWFVASTHYSLLFVSSADTTGSPESGEPAHCQTWKDGTCECCAISHLHPHWQTQPRSHYLT
jgi:hypothetical protein